MSTDTILVYPELGRIAIKEGFDLVYRMYAIARHLDNATGGDGWVDIKHFRRYLRVHGLSKAHERTAFNHELAPLFFWREGKRLHYRAISKLCVNLTVHFKERVYPGQPVHIPTRSLNKLSRFRPYLYAAWFVGERDTTISRAKLEELFGVTEETQRNWEKRVPEFFKQYNIAMARAEEFDPESTPIPQDNRDGRENRSYHWFAKWNGMECVFWQTPNSYWTDGLKLGRKGQTRKARSAVNAAMRGLEESHETSSGGVQRIFHTVDDIPLNPVKILNRPCLVAMPDTRITNKKGTHRVWVYSKTTPVGRRSRMRNQDAARTRLGYAPWVKREDVAA